MNANKPLITRVNQLMEMIKETETFLAPEAEIETNLKQVLRKGKDSCLREIRELEYEINYNCKVHNAPIPRTVTIGGIPRMVIDGEA